MTIRPKMPDSVQVDLSDLAVAATVRVRVAQEYADDDRWWRRQIRGATNEDFAIGTIYLLLAFASGAVIARLAGAVDKLLKQFPSAANRFMHTPYPPPRRSSRGARSIKVAMEDLPDRLRPETVVVLARGESGDTQLELYRKFLTAYRGGSSIVQHFCLNCEFALAAIEPNRWGAVVDLARSQYAAAHGYVGDIDDVTGVLRKRGRYPLPLQLAARIAADAHQYPWELAALSQRRLRGAYLRRIDSV